MDRIDIFVEVPPVEYEKLVDEEPSEDSGQVRQRVGAVREVQRQRFEGREFWCNSEMGPADVWTHCQLHEGAKGLLLSPLDTLWPTLSRPSLFSAGSAARVIEKKSESSSECKSN